jgi:hypothetical protein
LVPIAVFHGVLIPTAVVHNAVVQIVVVRDVVVPIHNPGHTRQDSAETRINSKRCYWTSMAEYYTTLKGVANMTWKGAANMM